MAKSSLDITFAPADELAQSGPGTCVRLHRPNGQSHVFWAQVGESVAPVLSGSLVYHEVTVSDGADENEIESLFSDAINGTGYWTAGASDPLAGIGTRLFQSRRPGGTAVLGQYKDTACTIPATEEGDSVAGIKDEFTGVIRATQSVSAKRGTVLLDDDGKPYVDFDGVDDWYLLSGGDQGGQVTYSALFKSNTPTFNAYWSLLDATENGARWAPFSSGETNFYVSPSPAAVNREGVALTIPFDLAPIDEEFIIATITTSTSAIPTSRGIGQMEQSYFGNFGLVALVMHDPVNTAAVQAYLQTLK